MDIENKNNIELPISRGKTYILRVLSIYRDLFYSTYGFYPIVPFGRFGKTLKTILESKTELQVSALLICFFNWHGMTGNDDFEYKKITQVSHNPFWFFSSINTYESYMRNVFGLDLDDEVKVRQFVALSITKLK